MIKFLKSLWNVYQLRRAYLADCFFARHPEYDSEQIKTVTAKIVKEMKKRVTERTPKTTTREIDQFQQMGNIIANSRYQREYAGEVVVKFWENAMSLEFDETGMKHINKALSDGYSRLSKSNFTKIYNTFTTKSHMPVFESDYQTLITNLKAKGFTIAHESIGQLNDNGRYVMAETLQDST